ncbi:hypothetical protein GOC74_13455 [Halomicrobium mukohataei]|uniref:DUF5518 domain-containing protein n=1 Tax=Halomicrobium mukohataei TaxID=57705 RepID=A0A847UI39_9EURY|nr:DUF5518 domain-containing protein [Halomicrobium mukohataei]NLV10931.1 hypothetical protein [Halomicrobium mukohataei]
MAQGDTLVNALIGAAVGTVAGAVLPLGPLLGGLTAGYLEGGDRSDGLRVGLYAGLVALIPLGLGGFVVGSLFGLFAIGVGPDGLAFGVLGIAFMLLLFALYVAYVVGFSALGGWLGNYVKYDTEIGS